MARFSGSSGSGEGTVGPAGPAGSDGTNGADGIDGKDSLFLGTWNSETEFLAAYQGGPVGLADGDWWAFVKDNSNPNKIYVVREDPNSATGWVIDDSEHFVLPAGADGADGNDGNDGAPGADGSQGPQGDPGPLPFNYLGEFDYGVTYAGNDAVTFQGGLWKLNNTIGAAGYTPTPGQWTLIIPAGTAGADGTNGNDGAPGADGNDGAQGPQGDPGSPGLVYLGNYVSGNGYIANLAVVKGSDNNLYIATSSGGLGDPVGNSAEWSIFLPKGEDGAPGADGEDAVLPQDLGITDSPTFNKITLTGNGILDNITIGDDVLLGDGNVANHLVIVGYQDPTNGGIVLGNNKTEQVSSDGLNLSLGADNDIILYPGSSYAYVGTPTVGGETRIATLGDLGAASTTSFQSVRYTPTFTATGLTFTGTGATHPTYNSYYVKQGQLVSFVIEVNLSTVTNFGTGQYKLQLPFTPQFGFNHFSGWAWADPDVDPDTGTGHTIINADTAGVTDVLDLHYLKSAGGANAPIREGLFLQGTPVTLSTISKIYINGTYIAA
jgi:hypothetical protein